VPEYVPPTPKKAFEPKPILPTQNQIKLPQSNGFEVRNDQKIDIPYDEDKIAISPSPEISLHLPPSIDNQKYLPLSSTKAVAKSSVQEPLNMNRLVSQSLLMTYIREASILVLRFQIYCSTNLFKDKTGKALRDGFKVIPMKRTNCMYMKMEQKVFH